MALQFAAIQRPGPTFCMNPGMSGTERLKFNKAIQIPLFTSPERAAPTLRNSLSVVDWANDPSDTPLHPSAEQTCLAWISLSTSTDRL